MKVKFTNTQLLCHIKETFKICSTWSLSTIMTLKCAEQLISIWTWLIVSKIYIPCVSLLIKNISHSLTPLFSCHLNYRPFGQDYETFVRLILMHLDQYMAFECQNIMHGKLIELREEDALHFSLLRFKIIYCLYS